MQHTIPITRWRSFIAKTPSLNASVTLQSTDYGRPVRKWLSLQSWKSTPPPKNLGTTKRSQSKRTLVYAFIGCYKVIIFFQKWFHPIVHCTKSPMWTEGYNYSMTLCNSGYSGWMHKREIKWSLEAISNQLVPTSSPPEAVLTESILCDKLLLFFSFLDPPTLLPKLTN